MKPFDIIQRFTIFLITVSCSLLVGCATMFAPDSDTVTIATNPQGAEVYSGANLLGKTPFTHSFDRNTFEPRRLTIRKEGYKNHEFMLGTVIEGKALFNFGFITTTFGATSWGIDAYTGNMIKYSPDSYLIDLEKDGNSKDSAQFQRLRFVAVNQDRLMKDIAARDGDYLKAYFESRPLDVSIDNYQLFLVRLSSQTPQLLAAHDPVLLFNHLEGAWEK